MADQPDQEEMARRLFGDAEKSTASAMEQLVHGNSFGELLARTTENAMAITRIGFETMDLVVRNLRIAGRKDIARLGHQLARTEDKLERVLQEVEELREEAKPKPKPRSRSRSSSGSSSSNGSGSISSRSRTRSKS
jgi:hypothetical protein